jgi:hypothetical protein
MASYQVRVLSCSPCCSPLPCDTWQSSFAKHTLGQREQCEHNTTRLHSACAWPCSKELWILRSWRGSKWQAQAAGTGLNRLQGATQTSRVGLGR